MCLVQSLGPSLKIFWIAMQVVVPDAPIVMLDRDLGVKVKNGTRRRQGCGRPSTEIVGQAF